METRKIVQVRILEVIYEGMLSTLVYMRDITRLIKTKELFAS